MQVPGTTESPQNSFSQWKTIFVSIASPEQSKIIVLKSLRYIPQTWGGGGDNNLLEQYEIESLCLMTAV